MPEHALMNRIVANRSKNKVALNGELKNIEDLYEKITQQAGSIDSTLQDHVAALKTRTVKRLQELEKKMLRAEKRKFDAELQQIKKIKSVLFPNNSLQERVENLAAFYAQYGKGFLDILLVHSNALEQKFVILNIQSH